MKPTNKALEANIREALAQWDELTKDIIIPLRLKHRDWYDRETKAMDLASTGITILGRKP